MSIEEYWEDFTSSEKDLFKADLYRAGQGRRQ